MQRLRLRPLSEWPIGQVVKVYRNLNNGKWSVKHGDAPVFHCDAIHLRDVVFHVNEKGRHRVLDKRQREVHAYAIGTMITKAEAIGCTVAVSYNPYHDPLFCRIDTHQPVADAYYAAFETRDTGEGPRCYINLFPF